MDITVKIKVDEKTYSEKLYLPDTYVISKQNAALIQLVQDVCDRSHLERISEGDVTLKVKMEM